MAAIFPGSQRPCDNSRKLDSTPREGGFRLLGKGGGTGPQKRSMFLRTVRFTNDTPGGEIRETPKSVRVHKRSRRLEHVLGGLQEGDPRSYGSDDRGANGLRAVLQWNADKVHRGPRFAHG